VCLSETDTDRDTRGRDEESQRALRQRQKTKWCLNTKKSSGTGLSFEAFTLLMEMSACRDARVPYELC